MTSTNNFDIASLVQGLESEIVASSSLPYCQVQNPPNISLAQVEKLKAPYGIFITDAQAALAGFTPDKNWELISVDFASQSTPGYIATKLRFIVISKSPSLVMANVQGRYKVVGETYKNGNLTEVGLAAQGDKTNYRIRQSLCIVFVDEDNKPLHTTPFKLSLSPAVGVGLGIARKQNVDELTETIFQLMNKPKQNLSYKAQALMVTELKLHPLKSGTNNAPYIYPGERSSIKVAEGTTKDFDNRGRSTKLVHTTIEKLLIGQATPNGQTIMNMYDAYQDYFANITNGEEDKKESEAPVQAPVQVTSDFSVDIPF